MTARPTSRPSSRPTSPVVRRLLVVEDCAEIAFALSAYFAHNGFEVTTVSTLDDARAVLGAVSFTAVIADWSMGDAGDGRANALCRTMSVTEPRPCCVLLTKDVVSSRDASATGADVVLMKPAPLAVLARALDEALRRREGAK